MRSRIPDLERFLASIAASLMLLISQAGFLWPEQSAAQARTNCVKTASHKSAGHSKNSSVSGHHRSKAGHSSSGHRKASARTASGRHRSRSTRGGK